MDDTMTARMAAIRARIEAATPGPWAVAQWVGRDVIEPTTARYPRTQYVCGVGGVIDQVGGSTSANAALIANAPADLAYLLDGLELLAAKYAHACAGIAGRAAREAALREALRAYASGAATGPETAQAALAANPTGEPPA